jgi:Protein of unknown function (DUF2723)
VSLHSSFRGSAFSDSVNGAQSRRVRKPGCTNPIRECTHEYEPKWDTSNLKLRRDRLPSCTNPTALTPSRRDWLILIATAALTRWTFRSRFLYDIDSVNFALALGRFDPALHQPHPPGYFLYVLLGRLLKTVFNDANTALVAISVAATCGTVVLIYQLASEWFDASAARFAGLLFVFSPVAWFHGTVALTYAGEAFFSALTAYFCWRVFRGATRFVLLAGATLALASGFRQSSIVVLSPLVLFSFRGVPLRRRMLAVLGFGVVLTAWWMPMLDAAGGARAYVSSLWSLWRLVPARQALINSSLLTSLARAAVIGWIFALCLGPAILFPLWARFLPGVHPPVRSGIKTFTWIWLLPGLLLFTFVYLKFVNSGYLLVLLPAVCIWFGRWASEWYSRSRLAKNVKWALLFSSAAANSAVFFLAPLYFSYFAVHSAQRELEAVIASVREIARPEDTVIVGFDSHFMGYRHAGYYLPEFLVLEFPEVPLHSGTAVFSMQNRNTLLLRSLEMGSFRKFILFPLPPSDQEYIEYMQRVRARFPSGVLRDTTHNGIEFISGPVTALAVLFPNTTLENQ